MKYGLVKELTVYDDGDTPADKDLVRVSVDFLIMRNVLFEFIDALRPINQSAIREPIEAILDNSAKQRIEVDELDRQKDNTGD